MEGYSKEFRREVLAACDAGEDSRAMTMQLPFFRNVVMWRSEHLIRFATSRIVRNVVSSWIWLVIVVNHRRLSVLIRQAVTQRSDQMDRLNDPSRRKPNHEMARLRRG